MSILNVDKIQPIGGGSTITVDATDIQASTSTITASKFVGSVSVTGISTFNDDSTFYGGTSGRNLFWDKSENALEFGDYTYAKFGVDEDLTIWSNNNASAINNKTGELRILSATNVRILKRNDVGLGFGGELANFNVDGSVELFNAGSKKIETTSSGATVTGTLTATSFVGALPISNESNDRVLTSSGSGAINAEANLSMTGNILTFNTTANSHRIQNVATGNHYTTLEFDSNRSSAGNELAIIDFQWDGDKVADIIALAGSDTSNKDDGHLIFRTSPSQGSISERLRIAADGKITVAANSDIRFTNGTWTGEVAGKIQHNSNNLYIQGGTGGIRFRHASNGANQFSMTNGGNLEAATGDIVFGTTNKGIHFPNSVSIKQNVSNLYANLASGNNNIEFQSNGTSFVKFRGTNGDVEIVDGNLKLSTSGHGIDFASNTDGGGTATGTLLDDYEQGTYSTTIVSSNLTADSTSGTGYYTKVGNMVYVRGKLGMNTNSGSPSKSGSDSITQALPYTPKSGGTVFSGTVLQQNINWGGPTSLAHPHYFNPVASGYVCMAASDGVRFYMNRVEYAYLRLTNDHLHVGYPGYTDIYWNLVYETD